MNDSFALAPSEHLIGGCFYTLIDRSLKHIESKTEFNLHKNPIFGNHEHSCYPFVSNPSLCTIPARLELKFIASVFCLML